MILEILEFQDKSNYLLDDTFQIPDFLDRRKKNKFIHLSGSVVEQIIISFDKYTSRYIMEYEADLADEIIETEGITYKKTAVTDELIRWILQFGQCKV